MQSYPPAIQRRISRLRWIALLVWIGWLVVAFGAYGLYRFAPRSAEVMQVIIGCAALLGLGVIWFIYIVYRLGELVRDEDE